MSAVTTHDTAGNSGAAPTDAPQVRTLLLTDLVDSTTLVERLGDGPAAALFREHDRLVLELQQRWRGRLIDRSDGLLLLFERPVDALGFALDYNRGLRALDDRPELKQRKLHLQARAGLHVGEVLTWRNSEAAVQAGAKPLEVEGIAKPLAGRLMTLARPGQILLSATAEPMAHRSARELGERSEHLIWKSHGRWRLKGVPDVQEIFEVGEPGYAPLRAPKENHAKAWRDIPLWRRPAALAAEVLLLVGIGTGAWFVTRPTPAIAFGERDWVVVGDLRNLTGDARLDESLDEAFRISLEQSNYVNLLSDLKVRETLQHMQHQPDATVDRAIGAEIALRDGARALLLATVAEVGGRLRVSAEVVDPHTQTTVFAVSADGKGIESVLTSIDEVTDGLREKLGEAMQNVQKTSVPLPNVATPSLDALKAFAVARNVARTTRDRAQAVGLYGRALQLDPHFALAYSDMARLHAALGDVESAADNWRKALAIPQRLSPQEKLRVELMLQQHTDPSGYFRDAGQYLALYPDDYEVIGRLGTNQWHQRNDFRQAEALFRRALRQQYERVEEIRYSLAVALLAQERRDEALAAFRKARQAGLTGGGEYYARVFDARGQHAESDNVYLASTVGRNGWHGDAGVVTRIDRNQWASAMATAESWLQAAENAGDTLETLRARAAIASVATLGPRPHSDHRLRELQSAIDEHGLAADTVFPPTSVELHLLTGLLAAYNDDVAMLAEALRRTQGNVVIRDHPTVAQLQQVLLAEQERLAGKPQAAAARMRPIVKRNDALVASRWALMRAEDAAGNDEAAGVQRTWLATHRGRVFAEATSTEVLRFFNVAVSATAVRSLGAAKPAPANT